MKQLTLTALLFLLMLSTGFAADRPNIIFIFSDDMAYGDLGYTGSSQIKTPHLDKLAKEGVIFPQAYVTAPVCGPSRMMALTCCPIYRVTCRMRVRTHSCSGV